MHAAKNVTAIELEQDLKTGALFAAGFEMFGMIQRLDGAEVRNLVALGWILERAFQSHDDLLDVQADTIVLGKDARHDTFGPGPARGLLTVRSLPEAEAHYHGLRIELDRLLGNCTFDSLALAAYIARVLPVSLRPGACAFAS